MNQKQSFLGVQDSFNGQIDNLGPTELDQIFYKEGGGQQHTINPNLKGFQHNDSLKESVDDMSVTQSMDESNMDKQIFQRVRIENDNQLKMQEQEMNYAQQNEMFNLLEKQNSMKSNDCQELPDMLNDLREEFEQDDFFKEQKQIFEESAFDEEIQFPDKVIQNSEKVTELPDELEVGEMYTPHWRFFGANLLSLDQRGASYLLQIKVLLTDLPEDMFQAFLADERVKQFFNKLDLEPEDKQDVDGEYVEWSESIQKEFLSFFYEVK